MLLVFSYMLLQPIQALNAIESDFLTSYEDVENANKNKTFGWMVTSHLKKNATNVSDQKDQKGEIVFKLFGFLPIKRVKVNLATDKEYYVGGVPVGLSINTDGAIIVSQEDECVNTLKIGDIITEIDGNKVEDINEISNILQKNNSGEVDVKLIRKNKPISAKVKTYIGEDDMIKLGLWVKDGVEGVGTLTLVDKESLEYRALGHPIVETAGGNVVSVAKGDLYECSLLGITKGKRHAPGELRCAFSGNLKSKGTIEDNSKFGIKGKMTDVSTFVDENRVAKLGGRLSIMPGKAKLISSVSGIREEYDIEIIKNHLQKSANDKSLIFRVKDKRLLELTGGIVQGMSGSPIMQNGKIVGAVTHVFTSDPTKGYGVYVDWMI